MCRVIRLIFVLRQGIFKFLSESYRSETEKSYRYHPIFVFLTKSAPHLRPSVTEVNRKAAVSSPRLEPHFLQVLVSEMVSNIWDAFISFAGIPDWAFDHVLWAASQGLPLTDHGLFLYWFYIHP